MIFLWLIKLFNCCSRNKDFKEATVLENLLAHKDLIDANRAPAAHPVEAVEVKEGEEAEAPMSNLNRAIDDIGARLYPNSTGGEEEE